MSSISPKEVQNYISKLTKENFFSVEKQFDFSNLICPCFEVYKDEYQASLQNLRDLGFPLKQAFEENLAGSVCQRCHLSIQQIIEESRQESINSAVLKVNSNSSTSGLVTNRKLVASIDELLKSRNSHYQDFFVLTRLRASHTGEIIAVFQIRKKFETTEVQEFLLETLSIQSKFIEVETK